MAAEPIDLNALMKSALRLRRSGEHDEAYRQLQAAIDTIVDDRDVRAELLSFAGDLYDEDGDPSKAQRAYEDALSLSGGSAYRRYSLELSLGALHERCDEPGLATLRYLAAVETALTADDVSAGSAIRRLVDLKNKRLNDQERQVCETGIEHSWRVLGLPGKPDTSDIAAAAAILIEASRR